MQQVLATRLDIAGVTMEVSASKAATRRYPLLFLCDLANAVLGGNMGEMLEYCHLITCPKYKEVWGNAYGKEIGRLAQGIPGKVEGTNTLFFVNKSEVPTDRFKDVIRDRIVFNVRPEKDSPNRVHTTVMGNLINHPGDKNTPTADLLTVKILLNSVISTPGAKFTSTRSFFECQLELRALEFFTKCFQHIFNLLQLSFQLQILSLLHMFAIDLTQFFFHLCNFTEVIIILLLTTLDIIDL